MTSDGNNMRRDSKRQQRQYGNSAILNNSAASNNTVRVEGMDAVNESTFSYLDTITGHGGC